MKFSGTVSKVDLKAFLSIQKVLTDLQQQAIALAAQEVRNDAIRLLNANSDGPKETRYGPKRSVNVSPPGSPPNTDTGRLVQSIKVAKDGSAYLVGTNVLYGAHLEFGTKDMAPRPWLSVALRQVGKRMNQINETIFKKFKGGLK